MKNGRGRGPGLAPSLVAAAVVMGLVLAAASIFAGAIWYTGNAARERGELGMELARKLAGSLSDADLTDTALAESLREIRDGAGARRVYICAPSRKANPVIVSSEYDASQPGFDLGLYTLEDLLEGAEVGPRAWAGNSAVTSPAPVIMGDRVYYAVVEFDMSPTVRRTRIYSAAAMGGAAILALMLGALYRLVVKKTVVAPVNSLTAAAAEYTGGENRQAFSKLRFTASPEFAALADSFRVMLTEIEANDLRQQELALEVQRKEGDMALAREINDAIRPKELPRDRDYPFRLSGDTRGEGRLLNGCFYDYFVDENQRLGFITGEASGDGISQALFTVIARTALKSRLSSGLSLEESVSAANRQLWELSGGAMYLNVTVGELDGVTGRMKLVNAGACQSLFMRFADERYVGIDVMPQAPMGQNENVSYTATELELNQGDRLFLHTRGLEDIEGSDGRPFRFELRRVLNEPATRAAELDDQLRIVSDAGGAFARDLRSVGPYALMALEYCRRDRMKAHCVITADARGAGELLNFVGQQLTANGVERKQLARTLVMMDELMALCRGRADGEARFMVECAVNDDLAVFRIRGPMGGVDPMTDPGAHSDAADFIRRSCERVLFEKLPDTDAVTVVQKIRSRDLKS